MRSEEWAGQEFGVVWGGENREEEPGFFLEAFTGHEEGDKGCSVCGNTQGPASSEGSRVSFEWKVKPINIT